MKKLNFSKMLYFFLFSNTFIAGLFNFLIPLYLLDTGFSFSSISLFIALNSLAFFLFLFVIEYLITTISISTLVSLTFGAYALYLSSVFFLQTQWYFIIVLGLISGIYLSLFWILQRLFFLETISHNNAGQKFGNLQIFVGVSSQLAILTGSYILEFYNFTVIYSISMFSLLILIVYNFLKKNPQKFKSVKRNTFMSILRFKDKTNSKTIFTIDGVFLFLESHFWLLIIFLFTEKDFFEVGIIVTVLAALFFIIYIFIKNKVDGANIRRVFVISTVLYSFSWVLRYFFVFIDNKVGQYALIYLIGFLTLFFRLVFNKIFFENAKKSSGATYILLKSYYSQFYVFVTFLVISIVFFLFNERIFVFNGLFVLAAGVSLVYLLYTKS